MRKVILELRLSSLSDLRLPSDAQPCDHNRTAKDEYGSIDWITQVRDDLLRFKLAFVSNSAGMDAEGAETGPPPSRITQVELSIATLIEHCSHMSARAFEIKSCLIII